MTFEEFVGARLGALLRYATAITCDPHLAEDVVQEVLLRAQRRWEHIDGLDQPEAYLRRMVLNEFLSWRRRRRAVTVGPLTLEAISAARPEGHQPPADHLEQRDAVVSLIAALPPRQRAVLALRYYEDCADAEIARLMGCSEATVRSHASRALVTLRGAIASTAASNADPRES